MELSRIAGLLGSLAPCVGARPTSPGGTSGFIGDDLRALCDHVKHLGPENFSAPNNNARKGRRNALCNKLNAAAQDMSSGKFQDAYDQLQSLLQKLGDVSQPPDWRVHDGLEDAKAVVHNGIDPMAFLITLEL